MPTSSSFSKKFIQDARSSLPTSTTSPVSSSSPSSFSTESTESTGVQSRLNGCELLISVLECYMTELLEANELKEKELIRRQKRYTNSAVNITGQTNDNEPSVFHALQAPSITPIEYLRRLARYSFCSRSVFVAAFYLLRRIELDSRIKLTINSLSIHRVLLTAVLLSTKSIDDVLYDNAHFAKVGGLDVKELNMLELDMLKVLDFQLHISNEEFEQFEYQLLYSAFSTTHPDFSMLATRLQNLGFVQPSKKSTFHNHHDHHQQQNDSNKSLSMTRVSQLESKLAPASPTSSMDVSFISE